jgi:hypothetical protein
LVSILAAGFDFIHGFVSRFDQTFGILAIAGVISYADTRAAA